MKKFTNSKIINLIFSFLLALLLAAYVLSTHSASRSGNNEFSSILPEKRINLTIPLNLQYNEDDYVVVGAPAQVNLAVHGPSAIVAATQSHNDIQALADLRDLGVGQHSVKLALKGVNSALTATLNPQTVNVTIAKKATKKVKIKVKYDETKLAKGYSVTNTTVSPKTVTVSGPQANVDAVESVGAEIALAKNTKSNVSHTVKLVAYDHNGNPVEIQLSNRSADVSLTVSNGDASKKVDLSADVSNGDAGNYNISFSPKTVTIYGSNEALNKIEQLTVPVDLSQVAAKTTLHVDINKPDGVNRLSDSAVDITVTPK